MSELRDRLERLAGRGTHRGADEVLQEAMRSAHGEAAAAPDDDGPDLEILDGDAPFVTPEPDVHRRGRYGTLVAAFGSAALLGVGVLAVTAMFGSGGAGSPEGAVRQLADAVSHKDPLAAVDVLVPSEVRSMRETVNHVTKRAADLKIVDDASAPLSGVDLSVDNLQLSTENLADGYAKVSVVSGTLSTSTHRAAMSRLLQDAISNTDTTDFKGKVDLARLAANSDLPTFVIAVRHGGGWYVSPAYTALEYAREINGGPAAAFGSAHAADLGADSPEAAVTDALHAWQAGNWDRLMALAPPDELPVYDYRKWIDQQAGDNKPQFGIDKLSTTATVNGDTAVVKLDASGTWGSDPVNRWQVGGTCPSSRAGWVQYPYSSFDTASSGGSSDSSSSGTSSAGGGSLCLAGDLGRAVPFGLMEVTGSDTQLSGPVSIEVVREDGRWFVSPVTTVLDAANSFIDHVDERSLYPLIGLGYKLPPDGTIALNQPFGVTGTQYSHVYALDGTQGRQVLGEVEGDTNSYASGELYTADGHDVGYVDFVPKNAGWSAPSETLPSTGSYRLVITGNLSKNATLTLFDTDHAPKSLVNPDPSQGGGIISSPGQVCTRTVNGETCTSSTIATGSGVVQAPRAPLRATPVPANSPKIGTATTLPSGCRRTASGMACTYSDTAETVPTTSVP